MFLHPSVSSNDVIVTHVDKYAKEVTLTLEGDKVNQDAGIRLCTLKEGKSTGLSIFVSKVLIFSNLPQYLQYDFRLVKAGVAQRCQQSSHSGSKYPIQFLLPISTWYPVRKSRAERSFSSGLETGLLRIPRVRKSGLRMLSSDHDLRTKWTNQLSWS